MRSIKVQALLLAYVLLAMLLHPCLCQGMATSATPNARIIDRKAIDQGIAYMLMFVALLVTYIIH